MRISTHPLRALLLATALSATAAPAFAQDTVSSGKDTPAATDPVPEEPKAVTLTAALTGITDYRFRGLTQTDENPALQATVNLNTKYGFYVGTWASTIDGDGSTPLLAGYGDAEVDLYAGYTKTFDGVTVDGGVLYYYYPSAVKSLNTDFFEPYASASYTYGPVTGKVGAAYAWGGQKGLDFTNTSDDNIYVYGELSAGIPRLPVTLKGHVGYTDGSLGLANLVSGNKHYFDWSLTAEAVRGPFKVGISYVDTDITNRNVAVVAPRGYAQRFGYGATVLGYIGLAY